RKRETKLDAGYSGRSGKRLFSKRPFMWTPPLASHLCPVDPDQRFSKPAVDSEKRIRLSEIALPRTSCFSPVGSKRFFRERRNRIPRDSQTPGNLQLQSFRS